MQNLYTVNIDNREGYSALTLEEIGSLVYHNIFEFPLNLADLIRWKVKNLKFDNDVEVVRKNGFFFLAGGEGFVYKRLLKKRISIKKMGVARNAAKLASFFPGVKLVAVTGSLAMENAGEDSDIDLFIITKKGTLWTTRIFVFLIMSVFGIGMRRSGSKDERDKLCFNMWMDETDLIWPKTDRNHYTAHEIAQILPLVNKDRSYEKFLLQNKWIHNYWPNSVKIKLNDRRGAFKKNQGKGNIFSLAFRLFEKIAYTAQHFYMKAKITREVVTPTKAVFHPQDWGKIVLSRLSS